MGLSCILCKNHGDALRFLLRILVGVFRFGDSPMLAGTVMAIISSDIGFVIVLVLGVLLLSGRW